MGIKDKIEAYKEERAKLKAIERSAYIGAKKKEKQRKAVVKQRKAVQKAEKAAEKGIAKAKAGGTWGLVAKAAKKEAAKWELGDGKVEPILKRKKVTAKKSTAQKIPPKKAAIKKGFPPQTKEFDGQTYKITGHVSSKKKAEFIKKNEAESGYKVRMIKTTKWGYLIYRRK